MYRSWLSSFQFEWTPIMTYSRRHTQLLDWLETNVEPVAFVDRPDDHTLGVGIVAPDLRLTVKRSGFSLESGLSGLGIDKLMPAIEGMFEVMEPRSVLATEFSASGSVALDDTADYYQLCALFGAFCALGPLKENEADLTILDGSSLVDLASTKLHHQAEWGIVTGDELLQRLRQPAVSRLDRNSARAERAHRVQHTKPAYAAPAVAVFVDQVGYWRSGGEVAGVTDVMNRVKEVQEAASTVCSGLADNFLKVMKEAR